METFTQNQKETDEISRKHNEKWCLGARYSRGTYWTKEVREKQQVTYITRLSNLRAE